MHDEDLEVDPHFPAWFYHRTLAAKLVNNKEQRLALGNDWADTPAAFDAPEPEIETPIEADPIDDEELVEEVTARKGRKKAA